MSKLFAFVLLPLWVSPCLRDWPAWLGQPRWEIRGNRTAEILAARRTSPAAMGFTESVGGRRPRGDTRRERAGIVALIRLPGVIWQGRRTGRVFSVWRSISAAGIYSVMTAGGQSAWTQGTVLALALRKGVRQGGTTSPRPYTRTDTFYSTVTTRAAF